MNRMASWWHELSGPAKFRLYTQLTLQVAVAGVAVVSATAIPGAPWASAGMIVSGVAAIFAIQAQPEVAIARTFVIRRWALPLAAVMLFAVWAAAAVAANISTAQSDLDATRTTGIFATVLASLSFVPFLHHRWWVVVGISVATGAAFGQSPTDIAQLTAITFVIAAFIVGTTLLTLWGLQVVDELERAKDVEARLQVAEERLRFARDLHDVVGRGFSAIAVKSELAATLSRAGAADRAALEMDEVKGLAVESMDQMRHLVRGYRDINLDGEVAGARSLLAAAGCKLLVEGDPEMVPTQFHEVAAWVVREGATNIVRHSSATSATLSIGAAGMTLHNNGTTGDSIHNTDGHTGLKGLSERLAQVGASLTASASDNAFSLEIQWEKT
ncbi:two-component system sensor histidine kinase DesK [Williamsia muralis]|uniref:Two-component system sensor histidine kinase DesK n=1 Tax=Williamsia marianensis TaxID=85044 RepID=A0A495KA68_WILMA|nr:histidine kinase [Williamsia muralis]RKR97454.1 two-component system sensor histidine kinase DesK [Williamsia muralis]